MFKKEGHVFPGIEVLMSSKTQEEYDAVHAEVRRLLPNFNPTVILK